MKYLCLRDCYTRDRFYYGGDTYNLPDDMVKNEKNFRLVEVVEPPPNAPESATEVVKEDVSIITPVEVKPKRKYRRK